MEGGEWGCCAIIYDWEMNDSWEKGNDRGIVIASNVCGLELFLLAVLNDE